MGLSGLNAHRKKYHFIENSICPNCHFNHENEIHFFLHCANYAVQRMVMMTQLQALFPNKNPQFWVPTTKKQQEDLVLLMTKGCGNEDVDTQIFNIAAKYIQETSRFEWN